jgi:PilZ domain-containing protein
MHEERRRSPRYDIEAGQLAVLPVAIAVQVLDISSAGVLLQSNHSTTVGARGRLTMTLGTLPFAAEVEVRRVADGVGSVGQRIGVMFIDISPGSQQLIEQFTRRTT